MSDRLAATYQLVADQILASLDQGLRPWRKSWASIGGQALRFDGQPYRGINQLMLSLTAMSKGYTSPFWMTYQQALELGGQVRKGERASRSFLFKKIELDEDKRRSEDDDGKRLVMRSYAVFNACQIDGLPARFFPTLEPRNPGAADPEIEGQLRACGATIVCGPQPCYRPDFDVIAMPPFVLFDTPGAYYATLAHELVHWTKTRTRTNRCELKLSYPMEELVAEIGACFACARLGIEGEHIDNHAAYIGHWKKALTDDPRCIFKACTLAQEAVDFLIPADPSTEGE